MRILWVSDSPTVPSGFGNVTRFVCSGLARLGHQIAILGWQAHGNPTSWEGCTIYPVRHDGFGADVLLPYLQKIRPDVLVTLADVWWLTFIANPQIANFMRSAAIPWALYYPIDGDMGDGRLPPSWVRVLQTVNLPIAMSEYGREVTLANGVTPAYIPHGVDTRVFHPPVDKLAAKKALGYEGKFVILSDARNQPRKLIPRTLEIFQYFSQDKDDVILHLHCDPDDPASQTPEYTYDLRADIAFLGLDNKVRLTEGMAIRSGLPLERLAAIYQAADVHLLASWGEGFGLPTLQAAAAGVVPLASDYTASRELVMGHGEPLRVYAYLPDQFGLLRGLIDLEHAVERLNALYENPILLKEKSHASAQFAQSYDWEKVTPKWHDLLLREMPRLRNQATYQPAVSQVTLRPQTSWMSQPIIQENEMTRLVRSAIPGIPDGMSVTVNVLESKAGQLTAQVYQDALASGHTLTLPVTLPPVHPTLVKKRIIACIYLTGEVDIPVALALSAIFPGLNVWSPVELDLGIGRKSGQPVHTKPVQPGSPAYLASLAASTLAIDLAGADQNLPRLAAQFGVPCIGRGFVTQQGWLWPDLSLAGMDVHLALTLARRLLTDQAEAEAVCTKASQRLAVGIPV